MNKQSVNLIMESLKVEREAKIFQMQQFYKQISKELINKSCLIDISSDEHLEQLSDIFLENLVDIFK
jgi:hypothetical protein